MIIMIDYIMRKIIGENNQRCPYL